MCDSIQLKHISLTIISYDIITQNGTGDWHMGQFNPIALRTAKTSQSFGSSECNRINRML